MTDGDDRRGPARAAAVSLVLLVTSAVAIVVGVQGTNGPPQPSAAAAQPSPTLTAPAHATARALRAQAPRGLMALRPRRLPGPKVGPFLPASRPLVLDVASIGIHATNIVDLRLGPDGSLDVPGNADEVGLYVDGPSPGQIGVAVLGAHVDSSEGPGVFYRLGALKPGADLRIGRKDDAIAVFTVDKVVAYPKDDVPGGVYIADFTRAEVRLITCGGAFDQSTGHYTANVVVYAHLTSVSRRAGER